MGAGSLHRGDNGPMSGLSPLALPGAVVIGGGPAGLIAAEILRQAGVEVDLCGYRARMAAGPAALAVESGYRLHPVTLRHERVGREWGMVIMVHDAVDVPGSGAPGAVQQVTQSCADAFGAAITEHTSDWHMMQRVFVDDLDADTDARRRVA